MIATEERTSIAELELYGLNLRIINFLEEECGLLYLDELEHVTVKMLEKHTGAGPKTIDRLREALGRFVRGEPIKTPWECVRFEHRGQDDEVD